MQFELRFLGEHSDNNLVDLGLIIIDISHLIGSNDALWVTIPGPAIGPRIQNQSDFWPILFYSAVVIHCLISFDQTTASSSLSLEFLKKIPKDAYQKIFTKQ
jgi:hypothetical protein